MPVPPIRRLRDRDVRWAIHEQLVPALTHNNPGKVLDEFQVCAGEARIDVAVVNGRLHGVEIKSEADTLVRLAKQIEVYGRVFDTMTIVCGENHLPIVLERVPAWWGISSARLEADGSVYLQPVRVPQENSQVQGVALAQLLWKDEIISLLESVGQRGAGTRKPKYALWKVLADAYPLEVLQEQVRMILKHRSDWRPALPQM